VVPIITLKRIGRGVFRSVADLEQAIKEYIATHNKTPCPFRWTASAGLVLAKVKQICSELLSPESEIVFIKILANSS
jgi:hypothetical protein